jgi:hypothetical protein
MSAVAAFAIQEEVDARASFMADSINDGVTAAAVAARAADADDSARAARHVARAIAILGRHQGKDTGNDPALQLLKLAAEELPTPLQPCPSSETSAKTPSPSRGFPKELVNTDFVFAALKFLEDISLAGNVMEPENQLLKRKNLLVKHGPKAIEIVVNPKNPDVNKKLDAVWGVRDAENLVHIIDYNAGRVLRNFQRLNEKKPKDFEKLLKAWDIIDHSGMADLIKAAWGISGDAFLYHLVRTSPKDWQKKEKEIDIPARLSELIMKACTLDGVENEEGMLLHSCSCSCLYHMYSILLTLTVLCC